MGGSEFEEDIRRIQIAMGSSSVVSIATCIVAILILITRRLYKHFVYRLAACQVFGSLFWNISTALILARLDNQETEYAYVNCKITGFLIEYSMWVKLLFTVGLTMHLFFYVVLLKNLRKYELAYMMVPILLPLLFVWVPYVTDNYGYADAWCFIIFQNNTTGVIEEFTLYYGPLLLLMSLAVIVVLVIAAVLLQRNCVSSTALHETSWAHLHEANSRVLKHTIPLLLYPIILFILILFPFISRTYFAAVPISQSIRHFYPFNMATGVIGGSVGAMNGSVLIAHMCYAQCVKRKKTCHSETECATERLNTKLRHVSDLPTYFSVPCESQLDDQILTHYEAIN